MNKILFKPSEMISNQVHACKKCEISIVFFISNCDIDYSVTHAISTIMVGNCTNSIGILSIQGDTLAKKILYMLIFGLKLKL